LSRGATDIRPATHSDHDAIWNIFHAVIATRDTCAFDPQMSGKDALAYWFRSDTDTYVAESDSRIVGTCILKPNQPAPSAYAANRSDKCLCTLRHREATAPYRGFGMAG